MTIIKEKETPLLNRPSNPLIYVSIDELVGKEVNFVFKIVNCRGLPNKYRVRSSASIELNIVR